MIASGNLPLAAAILQALAVHGAAVREPVSLARLAKQLDASGSAVLRELSFMSDAALGAHAGPGWVRVWQEDGRWCAVLTEQGARHLALLAGDGSAGPPSVP